MEEIKIDDYVALDDGTEGIVIKMLLFKPISDILVGHRRVSKGFTSGAVFENNEMSDKWIIPAQIVG